jgi:hypothetical protein
MQGSVIITDSLLFYPCITTRNRVYRPGKKWPINEVPRSIEKWHSAESYDTVAYQHQVLNLKTILNFTPFPSLLSLHATSPSLPNPPLLAASSFKLLVGLSSSATYTSHSKVVAE